MKRTFRQWIELRNIIPLIAIVLAFLATLGVPQKLGLSTEQVILAVLGVLAIDAVVERVGYLRRIEDSIKSGFGAPKAPFLQSRKDLARLPERAREAREFSSLPVQHLVCCSTQSSSSTESDREPGSGLPLSIPTRVS